jgi:hypothetical protein
MNTTYALAVFGLVVSLSAHAGPNWVQVPDVESGTAYIDKASFSEAGPVTIVQLLRSYEDEWTLDINVATRPALHQYRSIKLRYVVDCGARTIGVGSRDIYSGSLGDGQLVASSSWNMTPNCSSPSSMEERFALAGACAYEAATRQRSAQ